MARRRRYRLHRQVRAHGRRLTIIQRSLFGEQPAFFVTAGRRGGGKTTALIMLMMAATGTRPAAAAWSPNVEERRKAILAYLLEANPAIIWDNIPRGTQISCPHIEAACTTALYTDRRLGVTENITVSAATINLFTGNNIGPKGDFSSRSLKSHLEVDRHDPENRKFKHPDPIGWTDANRVKILQSLYTIMLGNPALRPGSNADRKAGSRCGGAPSHRRLRTPQRFTSKMWRDASRLWSTMPPPARQSKSSSANSSYPKRTMTKKADRWPLCWKPWRRSGRMARSSRL